jgi:hypothetical protein
LMRILSHRDYTRYYAERSNQLVSTLHFAQAVLQFL